MEQLSDAELVSFVRQGNQRALAVLYDRYVGLVYSIAYNILQNPQESEDLVQDIFLNFWKNTTFDAQRGALSSFLGLLTRSRAIDKTRRRTTAKSFLDRWQRLVTEETLDPLPLDQVVLQERQLLVQTALQQLPEMQRRVLELSYYEGQSHSQISQTLELSLGVVKSRTRQGLQQLKQLLQATLEEAGGGGL